MFRNGVLFVLVSAATLLPFSARALVLTGDLPLDFAEDMEIVDGLAYLVSRKSADPDAPTLRILDLSDPTSPVEIGSLHSSHGAEVVEVVGGLAYITDDGFPGNLRIIDVSDPTAPVEIGAFPAQFKPIDVAVVGNYAYLMDQLFLPRSTCCGAAFRVIDVSNPAAPVQVSERFLGLTFDIEAVEGLVYASGIDLELIDVSNPAAPVTVGVLSEIRSGAIEVADGYVYAAGFSRLDSSTGERYGFQVIDVMDPTNPFRVGRGSASGESIEVVGGLAYIGGSGLQVVDISNPAAPTRRGSIYSYVDHDVAVHADHAYLPTPFGVSVVDLSVLDTPTELGWAEVEGPDGGVEIPNDVEVSDGVAYLAVGNSRPLFSGRGLRTFDVTNPTAPVALGGIDTADFALDVELVGGLAYVAAGRDGLRVFDVTTPSAPVAAGGLAFPGSTAKVEVVGTTAYVVDRGTRSQSFAALRIIDVSNAATPLELGAIEFRDISFGRCRIPGIAVVEKLVYVTCNRLFIVDVSDPAQPELIFAGGETRSESSIAVVGDHAYIGRDEFSLLVYDISDPALPVEVGEVLGGGRAIVVENGIAYSAGDGGLAVHDLAVPLAPVLLGGYPSDRGDWNGLAIANGLFFGVTSFGRLQVVDLGPEYARARSVEIAIRAEGEAAVVNLASRGVLSVTILGAADFDVAQIDRSTLRFGPSSTPPAHKMGGHLDDVNGDGRPDLVSHYRIADTGISEADEEACVSGQAFDGTSIGGCGTLGVMLPRGQADASSLAN